MIFKIKCLVQNYNYKLTFLYFKHLELHNKSLLKGSLFLAQQPNLRSLATQLFIYPGFN